MPRLFVVAIALAAFAVCATASAQVYKWRDANGTTHYSDAPPPTGSKYEKVSLNGNVTTPAPAPASSAPKPADTAAAPPAQTATSVPDTPDNRASLCRQLDGNIALLSSKQTVTASNGKTSTNISDDQRQQALANAQAQKKQYCKE